MSVFPTAEKLPNTPIIERLQEKAVDPIYPTIPLNNKPWTILCRRYTWGLPQLRILHCQLTPTTYQAMKKRGAVHYSRKVLQCRSLHESMRTAIGEFVQGTMVAIEVNNFAPLKYTDTDGSRQYSLAPIHSLQFFHISLNKETILPILTVAGLP